MNAAAHPRLPLVWETGDLAGAAGPAASGPLLLELTTDELARRRDQGESWEGRSGPADSLLLGAVIAQLARYGAAADLPVRLSGEDHLITIEVGHQVTAEGASRLRSLRECAAAARAVLSGWQLGARFSVVIESDVQSRDVIYNFASCDNGRYRLTVRSATRPRGTASLDRIANHYASFFRAVVHSPDRLVADVSYLTTREVAALADLNNTWRSGAHESCIHHLVEAAASRDPAQTAVIQDGNRLTFGDLDQAAAALAVELLDAGITVGDRVGIIARRSIEFVVAAFAILRVGAAYVPLDSLLPVSRLKTLLGLSGASALLAEHDSLAAAAELTENCVTVPPYSQMRRLPRSALADSGVTGADLAYVIFTSGSTGEPKGVLLDHFGRTNMIADLNERFGLTSLDRTLVVSSPGFDMSVYDIFGTLAAGATVVLPDRGREYDVDHWARLIIDEEVTTWHSVPSALTLLLNIWPAGAAKDSRSALRLFLVGGDWIPASQPARVRAAFPLSRFYSLGGATEVSVDSVIHEVEPGQKATRPVPYGRPLANQSACVLDACGQAAGFDHPGELALGGAGVAWGYEGLPGLTASKFAPDPDAAKPGGRRYLTGDRARLRHDGQIELLGRLDQQVKIDGVRVELGEVQTALEADPLVREAAVLAARDANGRALSMVAFVVPAETGLVDLDALAASLLTRLEDRLPRAMLPARIEPLDALPVNANGKVNRLQLQVRASEQRAPRQPDRTRNHASGEFVAAVAETWAEVLGLDSSPSPAANFLALGGGSLAATQIILRLNRRFGADLTMRDVIGAGTVTSLAILVSERSGTGAESAIPRIKR